MKISTKEKIILATLDLAAEHGLKSLSMSQIAEKVGIKKPSLYNHFDSKDSLIKEMYKYLREKSKDSSVNTICDDFKNKEPYDVLFGAVLNYKKMVSDKDMMKFYKVIYAERSTDKNVAEIVMIETNKMIEVTKVLFSALNIDSSDTTAISFALTIHGLIDYELDAKMSGKKYDKDAIQKYIKWFLNKEENEK